MLQCILQLYVENTVASPWCCSPCYGRGREQRAGKKRSEAVGRASHSTAVGCFWGRSHGNLGSNARTSQPCSCRSGKPFAWPMSQKGSLVNSEERHETCHSLSSKRLLAFFRVQNVHADMRHLHMPHALNRRWRSTSIVIDCFLWAQAKPHDQSVLAASRGVCWMADT